MGELEYEEDGALVGGGDGVCGGGGGSCGKRWGSSVLGVKWAEGIALRGRGRAVGALVVWRNGERALNF